jgi:tRNA (guanosine-2'-O-)-methyltransferase
MSPNRRSRIEFALNKRQGNLTLVLENVFDPHNISAVMRSCDAVGVQEMFVLNTRIAPHRYWGPKSSRGANKWVTIHQYTNAEECFNEVRKKYSKVLTTQLHETSVGLYEVDFLPSIALVFGNECYGVSEDIQKFADGSFVIPQVGMIQSLNISVACAVTLYEAFRQKNSAGHYKQGSLPQEEYNKLYNEWGLHEEQGTTIEHNKL